MTPRTWLFCARRPPEHLRAAGRYELLVRRRDGEGREGGLGVDVDETNVVAADLVPDRLLKGDRILAVDGMPLGDAFIARVLDTARQECVARPNRRAALCRAASFGA